MHEITAKSLLIKTKKPSMWFHVMYNMNIYRGCSHGCIYCDSRSDCYQLGDFEDIGVKTNALEILRKELPRKRVKGMIGTGAMSDPYIPLEKKLNLTGQALELIAEYCYPVTIVTKSNLILKDIDALQEINKRLATVVFTLTTVDDELAKIIEPHAPLPSKRLEAMGILSTLGIYVGVTMMPILPFIEDNVDNIRDIVIASKKHGAAFIIPAFGMTNREGQREYYYQKLDEHFPRLKEKYIKKFGSRYSCSVNNWRQLSNQFMLLCRNNGLVHEMSKIKKYGDELSIVSI